MIHIEDCHIYNEEGYCELCPAGKAFNGIGCHVCVANIHDMNGIQIPEDIEECSFNWPAWKAPRNRFMTHMFTPKQDPKIFNQMLWGMGGGVQVTGRKAVDSGSLSQTFEFQGMFPPYVWKDHDYDDDGCHIKQNNWCNKCKDTYVLQKGCGFSSYGNKCSLMDDLFYHETGEVWFGVDHGRTGSGYGNLIHDFYTQPTKCEKRHDFGPSVDGCSLMSPSYADADPICMVCDYRKGLKMCLTSGNSDRRTRCSAFC